MLRKLGYERRDTAERDDDLDTERGQADSEFETGQIAQINLLHYPADNVMMGTEFIWDPQYPSFCEGHAIVDYLGAPAATPKPGGAMARNGRDSALFDRYHQMRIQVCKSTEQLRLRFSVLNVICRCAGRDETEVAGICRKNQCMAGN